MGQWELLPPDSHPLLLGTTYLQPVPPMGPTLMSSVVVYLVVVSGTRRAAYVQILPKGLPASQFALPLTATPVFYRPWCNHWGPKMEPSQL